MLKKLYILIPITWNEIMRTKITTNLFWLSACFIIASMVYVVLYTSEIQEDAVKYRDWSDHSRNVLLIAERVAGTFESTLAEQRGYLLTADKEFEDRFQAKGQDVIAGIEQLIKLVKNNPEQLARAQQMQELSKEYVNILDGRSQKYTTIKGGRAVLRFNAQYYEGLRKARAVHDTFMKTTRNFLRAEHRILSDRLDSYNEARRKFVHHFVFSLVMACLLIICCNWIILVSQRRWLLERARFQNIDDRYRVAVKATNDGIFDWDIPGGRIFLSSQIFQMCGYNLPDYEGPLTDIASFMGKKNPVDLIHPDDIDQFYSCLRLFEDGHMPDYVNIFRVRHAQGNWVWVHGRGSGLYKNSQKPYRLIGSHTDITVAKQMEERLRAEKEAADNSSKMKMEFLSHMSHEIRTPLTTINGASEILVRASQNYSDRDKALVKTLHASAGMLRELINDILDFSRIESGEISIVNEPVCLDDICDQVFTILSVQAAEKNITFQSKHDRFSDVVFDGDEARIRQIMMNLAGNAIKFTEKGSVSITPGFAVIDKASSRYEFRIDVTDTGIGIAEDALTHIFERFYQADVTVSKKYKGTGLGLAISKGLATAMGGRIEAISTEGHGSTFSLILPVTVLNPEILEGADLKSSPSKELSQAKPPVAVAANDNKVLLVEDYEGNIVVITCMIEEMGYACDVARNGQEAVDMAKKGGYNAILMDIQMPVMDGLTATVEIRKSEKQQKRRKGRVPIIGMTAHATRKDMEKCLAAGMDSYISKPIHRPEFEQVLKEFAGQKGT